jgi:hypothetical protein
MTAEGLAGYMLRVYANTDNGGNTFSDVEVYAGGSVIDTFAYTSYDYSLGGSRANGDSGVLTADTITIDPTDPGSGQRATIAGVQIMALPVVVTPYLQINDGLWQQTDAATLNLGDKIVLSPDTGADGTWSWSGPDGFNATTREVTIDNIQSTQSGDYTVTFTSASNNEEVEHTFTITVFVPDNDPPMPNPAVFAIEPVAISPDSIIMVAERGIDVSGPMIEYYFTCTSGGGHDSGWQTSASYKDIALDSNTTYEYTVMMRDMWGNVTTASSPASATTEFSDQAPFEGAARPLPGKIEGEHYDEGGEMDAYHDTTPGNTRNLYRFDDVDIEDCGDVGGGYDIGYIKDGEWLEYTVDVTSGFYNISGRFATYSTDRKLRVVLDGIELCILDVPQTGGWGIWQTATTSNIYVSGGSNQVLRLEMIGGDFNFNWIEFTQSDINTEAPTPNPMTWSSEPTVQNDDSAVMVCTTASHADGVEYYFEETSGNTGGDDSGWQSETSYTDADLQPGYTYTYRLKARSLNAAQSETEWSAAASCTPDAGPFVLGVINVDFQNAGQTTFNGQGAFADPGNDYWNAYEEGNAVVSLLKSDGTTASGASLEVTGYSGSYEYANTNALLADYFYTQNADVANISVTGLGADQECQLYVYLGGDQLDQLGIITLNGVTVEQTINNIGAEYVLDENYFIMNVAANESGAITGTFQTVTGTGFAAIKGMQIMAIPEPAIMGLLVLGLLGFLRFRK